MYQINNNKIHDLKVKAFVTSVMLFVIFNFIFTGWILFKVL